MLIAGEASGDLLGAELVQALRRETEKAAPVFTNDPQPLTTSLEPRFFGAGGPRMAAAGVDLAFDLTRHSVIGLSEAVKRVVMFRRLFRALLELARHREPDAIICVDFSWFNMHFASAIKRYVRRRHDWFHDWTPKVIRYVSPQVWASREGRAYALERDCDLLLSIFPFEKEWFAQRVPRLRVEFVGHPMAERYGKAAAAKGEARAAGGTPMVLLLPGSRSGELRRHLPVVAEAAKRIRARREARFRVVLPREELLAYARPFEQAVPGLELQVGGLEEALRTTDVALAKSGTITLECAYFGVPAVVFYKTSLVNYLVARPLVRVRHLAMPNLLADETVYPEFVQGAATPDNLANAVLALLEDRKRYAEVQEKLAKVVASLGGPGASERAARAVLRVLATQAA